MNVHTLSLALLIYFRTHVHLYEPALSCVEPVAICCCFGNKNACLARAAGLCLGSRQGWANLLKHTNHSIYTITLTSHTHPLASFQNGPEYTLLQQQTSPVLPTSPTPRQRVFIYGASIVTAKADVSLARSGEGSFAPSCHFHKVTTKRGKSFNFFSIFRPAAAEGRFPIPTYDNIECRRSAKSRTAATAGQKIEKKWTISLVW